MIGKVLLGLAVHRLATSPVPHARAIASPSDLKTGETYTLWIRIGKNWLIERSYGGAYLRSLWDEVKASWSTTRPYAIFRYGDDPNG
jgi:hypothetical protein